MLSPSASSSAVTIPTPGKSILKRPPPPQQSFFSLARLSKLLPSQTQQQSNGTGDEALKRAHFILPELTTVYPILAANPPSSPSLKEEKRSIEEREAERRRRILRGGPSSGTDPNSVDEWWSLDQVESFYRECCDGREESPDTGISTAFKRAAGTKPRTVDFSGVQLTVGSASVLSDVFTIEWGLRKVVFKECNLDEQVLKPILHALLIPNSLTFLSVASNRRLKAPAFRLIGVYVSKAKTLQFLDLSQNVLDKKSIEYIASSLAQAPNPGLVSLRLDDCSLKPAALDALANAIRTSSLRNISLRYNRINATGAVAVALMIKDYPDRFPSTNTGGSTPTSPTGSSPNNSTSTLFTPPATPTIPPAPIRDVPPTPPPRAGPVLPPPRHPAAGPQTTYTPYIPRSRRPPTAQPAAPQPAAAQQVPLITSSAQGGVTTRHPVPPVHPLHQPIHGLTQSHDSGPSAALMGKVRALDALPRLGALRTLDLRGNDIRNGITYIAQVLKRNRTLKVLNLSENKLDVQGLVAIAEALKYNSCLETLDLSKNPCCGPGLEGIQSLRTAFTLNEALKRLFLCSTSMTSLGAIALAEFLPESKSLLHLDLTMNNLDLAGVMALSSGLKANHTMRCLDLNIPPGDEEMARMCRDILNTCVRNTEEAEKKSQVDGEEGASGRGQGKGVWGMIEESELAKFIRQGDQKKVDEDVPVEGLHARSQDPADVGASTEQTETDLVLQAHACKKQLEDFLAQTPSSSTSPAAPHVLPQAVAEKAKELKAALMSLIEVTTEPARLEALLALNDDLTNLLARATPRYGLGIQTDVANGAAEPVANGHALSVESDMADEEPLTPRVDKGKGRAEPEPEEPEKVLSPTFLITESDDEDAQHSPDAEVADLVSPTDLSRRLVEEEGEVFRKGTVLLGPEEMEGEYDGEELRRELLEAMVERPPPRSVVEEFPDGSPPRSPVPPSSSPTEPKRPPPRPYIRRSQSAGSTTSPIDTQNVGFSDRLQEGAQAASPRTSSPNSPSIPGRIFLGRRLSASSKESE
ncbi:RNI-like protein [Obba rivulosa]|uniref:RNI-like protein n=1 Tax=Obba rivulosa TaxID=1052685 RepID=A0A8E2AMI1_9APHY|nr:RNI-like protein [Obba rivulosa]